MADTTAQRRPLNRSVPEPAGKTRPNGDGQAPFPGPEWDGEDDLSEEWDEDWAWDEEESWERDRDDPKEGVPRH